MSRMAMRRLARQPWGRWGRRVFRRLTRSGDGGRWLDGCYLNNRYSVQISALVAGGQEMLHLRVRRHDGAMPRSWADLQRIKDELVGAERVAVQVFPAASELVDEANLAHLWVFPEGYRLPFGLHSRRASEVAP